MVLTCEHCPKCLELPSAACCKCGQGIGKYGPGFAEWLAANLSKPLPDEE